VHLSGGGRPASLVVANNNTSGIATRSMVDDRNKSKGTFVELHIGTAFLF
jgi:hypothetical protein